MTKYDGVDKGFALLACKVRTSDRLQYTALNGTSYLLVCTYLTWRCLGTSKDFFQGGVQKRYLGLCDRLCTWDGLLHNFLREAGE